VGTGSPTEHLIPAAQGPQSEGLEPWVPIRNVPISDYLRLIKIRRKGCYIIKMEK
jgi:hypothetical protein